jgi:hypothetical protein
MYVCMYVCIRMYTRTHARTPHIHTHVHAYIRTHISGAASVEMGVNRKALLQRQAPISKVSTHTW